MSLMLALVMVFSLTTGAGAANTQNIKVQLSPDITVKYNGEVQTMADVNGNPVYPLFNGGTTYLPVRAVSNMLGLNVDWDGATQTVYLAQPRSNGTSANSSAESNNMPTITFDSPTVERIRKHMEMFEYPEEAIEAAIAEFVVTGPNGENGEFIYKLSKKYTFKTSDGVKTLGDKHVAYGYAEVDYSMADEGYVKVKLTNQVCEYIDCSIDAANTDIKNEPFKLKLDQWANIPLLGGSDYYQLTLTPWPAAGERPYPLAL